MKWAAIRNGRVSEVVRVDPKTIFSSAYASSFIECPDDVEAGWSYSDGVFSPPEPEPEMIRGVPAEVTMRQARLYLLNAGLLSSVDSAIESITDEKVREAVRIEWEYSNTVSRNSDTIKLIGERLGLSSEQIDNMFVEASRL